MCLSFYTKFKMKNKKERIWSRECPMSSKEFPMSKLALGLELVMTLGEMDTKRGFSVTNINNAQTLLWNKYQTLAWILIEVAPGQKRPWRGGECPSGRCAWGLYYFNRLISTRVNQLGNSF